jgi:mono/diheme cytochrome c family protein
MKFLIIALIFIAGFSVGGCYYDVESELYPKDPNAATCDTLNVTYTSKVLPIIQTNCYTCHSGNAVAGGNVMLEGYTNLQKVAADGRLFKAISHTPGVSAMPKGGTKLADCDIRIIKRWIDTGIQNN